MIKAAIQTVQFPRLALQRRMNAESPLRLLQRTTIVPKLCAWFQCTEGTEQKSYRLRVSSVGIENLQVH
jgi:hypothetical protein